MFSHLIFDYDGTLVDSLTIYLQGFQKVFAEFGIKTNEFEIAEKCFGTINGAKNLGVTDTSIFYKKVDELINSQIKYSPLFNNVEETLNKLKDKNITLSIVSSSSIQSIERDLNNKGILDYFSVVISSNDVEVSKPNPEGILKVVNYYKLPKENFLMVGDSKKDLLASKNAGIKSCLFYPIQSEKYYIYKDLVEKYSPDFVIKDFKELLYLV